MGFPVIIETGFCLEALVAISTNIICLSWILVHIFLVSFQVLFGADLLFANLACSVWIFGLSKRALRVIWAAIILSLFLQVWWHNVRKRIDCLLILRVDQWFDHLIWGAAD